MKFINLSLSTLGTIISALNSNQNTHVPYRNSKLTRVLQVFLYNYNSIIFFIFFQSSLNGSSKVFLIVTISKLEDHLNESISTCLFASRCKDLNFKPSIKSFEEDLDEEGVLLNNKQYYA